MSQAVDEIRPEIDPNMDGKEFSRWYWPVKQLKQFCDALDLPSTGTKKEIRDRVEFKLKHPNAPTPKTSRKKHGPFNWAKEILSKETIITENISFGPNVRNFFKAHIGSKFVCHSDFMDWMRANSGLKLSDAIDAWHLLEQRKEDPEFRREIATCNNYLQYLRDARDTVPTMTLDEAKACWDYKKIRPATDGIVVFEVEDKNLWQSCKATK